MEPPSTATQAPSLAARGAMAAAGLGLLAGFFLPWIELGEMASMSGFSLLVTGGDAVRAISGPHRALLFAVPLGGVALCAAAWLGRRGAVWVALATGAAICTAGVIALLLLFLDTTGAGMWVVALSALAALAIGGFGVRQRG